MNKISHFYIINISAFLDARARVAIQFGGACCTNVGRCGSMVTVEKPVGFPLHAGPLFEWLALWEF